MLGPTRKPNAHAYLSPTPGVGLRSFGAGLMVADHVAELVNELLEWRAAVGYALEHLEDERVADVLRKVFDALGELPSLNDAKRR